ncbi:MAG: glycosyltransferase family 2 protein [Flavobacteriaceae bacterium]|nr:glycosyltransferase family 2 protein [Flavobacteriaceae bacterium]
MNFTDISIITINYNTSSLTKNFILSVEKCTSESLKIEFIVIDNCSGVNDYKKLEKDIKELNNQNIKLLRSNINLGFGGGNMLGTQYASGKYLAFINNDILFTEDCFSSLIRYHENNAKCGVSTPQQYNINNEPTSSFDYFHGIRKELFGRKLVELTSDRIKREKKHYKDSVIVDFIQGCFMFFPTSVFAEIGGYDTNLFLYYEEMDVCYRLNNKGYTSVLVPETSFQHLHGASTPKSFLIKKELKISQLYISRKNHYYLKHLIIRFSILLKTFFKPKYWGLIPILITGKYLENSLKQSQQMVFNK